MHLLYFATGPVTWVLLPVRSIRKVLDGLTGSLSKGLLFGILATLTTIAPISELICIFFRILMTLWAMSFISVIAYRAASAILSSRYRVKMIGVHARHIEALVVKLKINRNGTLSPLVTDSMSPFYLAINPEAAIPFSLRRRPVPTAAGTVFFLDLIPKSIHELL